MTAIRMITGGKYLRRQVALLVLILLGSLTLFAFSSAAHAAATLRHSNVITDGSIKLGDIFSGLRDQQAGRILGAAPRPGQDMVLNARTLMRIAIAMDLSWRPSSAADHIVLSSAATLIDQDMIVDKLSSKLRDKGISGKFDLILSNKSHTEMVLPHDADKNIAVQSVEINKNRDWFNAVMVGPSLDNPLQRIQVSGKIERTIELPVLSNNLRNGTVIGKSDIHTISIPARNVNADYILSHTDLIGKTPRRIILSGQPIKAQDISAPIAVERGKSVTMIFESGGLRLTALGKALQSGSPGDIIRVVNTASNRTIDAEISGNQEVVVRSF